QTKQRRRAPMRKVLVVLACLLLTAAAGWLTTRLQPGLAVGLVVLAGAAVVFAWPVDARWGVWSGAPSPRICWSRWIRSCAPAPTRRIARKRKMTTTWRCRSDGLPRRLGQSILSRPGA